VKLPEIFSRKPKWERAWRQREEERYPALFGEGEGIFPLAFEVFSDVFGQDQVDPRWLHVGTFRFSPTAERPTWLHVSSGLSNDWEQEGVSGLGCELVLETPWKSDRAIEVLNRLVAYDLLLAHGRYGEPRLLEVGTRLHSAAAFGEHGAADGFLIVRPEGFPDVFSLETGPVQLLACVGVTEAELACAKAEGSAVLDDRLAKAGVGSVTDPTRASVV
jgi:hypothetical protein